MTEQTTETTDVQEPDSQDTDTGQAAAQDGQNPSREAAKWRTRLRETEAERDALSARVTALQTAQVVQEATGPGKLYDGQDVLRDVDLADLLDDDGDVDPQKINAAIEALTESKPHLKEPVFNGDAGAGQRGSNTATSWADVIKG